MDATCSANHYDGGNCLVLTPQHSSCRIYRVGLTRNSQPWLLARNAGNLCPCVCSDNDFRINWRAVGHYGGAPSLVIHLVAANTRFNADRPDIRLPNSNLGSVWIGYCSWPNLDHHFRYRCANSIDVPRIIKVPEELLEAGKAFGASRMKLLFKVELPAALPSIMAGVTQCIMLSLSMVVIAALVGADGLGKPVVRALNTVNISQGFEAGLAIVLVAIILDRLCKAPNQKEA